MSLDWNREWAEKTASWLRDDLKRFIRDLQHLEELSRELRAGLASGVHPDTAYHMAVVVAHNGRQIQSTVDWMVAQGQKGNYGGRV